MNDIININDLTVVGTDKAQFEKLKEALSGSYIQWTGTFFFPIEEIAEIEVTNLINDTKSPFYAYNMKSLNTYYERKRETKKQIRLN